MVHPAIPALCPRRSAHRVLAAERRADHESWLGIEERSESRITGTKRNVLNGRQPGETGRQELHRRSAGGRQNARGSIEDRQRLSGMDERRLEQLRRRLAVVGLDRLRSCRARRRILEFYPSRRGAGRTATAELLAAL